MKASYYYRFFLLISLLIVLSGCNKNTNIPVSETKQPAVIKESSQNTELKVWAYDEKLKESIQHFESLNPQIKINLQIFEVNELNNACMKAISAGTGPDVLFLDSIYFGQYTINGLLDDLQKEPYSAGKYEKDFNKDVWESNKSADGKSLLAITLWTAPVATFYRADVMKENGFPSEPEEFGKFIENPENLFAIAQKLKPKDKYIFQWPTDLPNLIGATTGIYDSNLKYLRNTDEFVKALDIAKKVHKSAYELEAGFWDERGKKAIQDEKLVMVYNLGSWGADTLKNYAPEQSGKWRATKPPLGIIAWQSDTKIAINAVSTKKESAWKFIEYMFTQQYGGENYNLINAYKPARRNPKVMSTGNPYLGNQVTQPLFEDLGDKMVQYKLTPLDDKTLEIFYKDISEAVVNGTDSKTALEDMANKIESTFSEERKALLQN